MKEKKTLQTIRFQKKIGEKNIDLLINKFYILYTEDKEDKNEYLFDFSDVEWIDNQGILVITGLLKYLVETSTNFKFCFLKNESGELTDKRIAIQFVEIWEIWKIYEIVPNKLYKDYFDIDGNYIQNLKNRFNIKISNQEIYDRYGITPFLTLNKVDKYEDRKIGEMISNIYNLNEATNEILKENNCYLPFENETISSIITKELYENFLDHFQQSIFQTKNDFAFMSIALKRKIKLKDGLDNVQYILKQNFEDESIEELKDFYFDRKKNKFKNESLLQISFLDFGEGITKTLAESYSKSDKKGFSEINDLNIDSHILEYAFMPNSSQHEIHKRYQEAFVSPRGLFDLLSIIKRFEGLIITRSNFGKIAFDFSNNKDFQSSVKYFGEPSNFFPGTLINIYIPERNLEKPFDYSSIKPLSSGMSFNFNSTKKDYISLFEIQKKFILLSYKKEEVYNNLFKELITTFKNKDGKLIYIDFKGYEIDERITKKIIYFLCSDYSVNSSRNVIVINPPPIKFLESFKEEIVNLSLVEKKFTIHPTVFVYVNTSKNNLELFWLGVYSENDINKLNELLFESHNLSYSDFENPDDLIGHINSYDKYGNFLSVIDSKKIIDFYKERIIDARNQELNSLINPYIKKEDGAIYLCNGNYYQYEYLQLFDVLNNKESLKYLANELFQELFNKIDDLENYKFIGITASSQKIIQSFIENNGLSQEKCILLNNYFSFEKEKDFVFSIDENDKVILICDVISTGYLVNRLEEHLGRQKAELKHIAVLVDAIDTNFKKSDYSSIKQKLIALYPYEMKKYQRSDISQLLQEKRLKVIRINPLTNTPITQTISDTNYSNSVLLENEDFINFINPNDIKVGYFSFNNLIHPYFFDMKKILLDKENSEKLLKRIFEELEKQILLSEIELIFYPKNSGVQYLDFNFLRDNILKNHKVEVHELERFSTNEGWRFSHPAQFLITNSSNKNVLILDDGSCSGESILQMIDEVAFLEVKKISVLSIIGRVNEHKREFFSRIKSINNNRTNIEINVFFGSHWHIPTYYLSKSPVVAERYWLKKLINFPSIPINIKNIAKGVSQELKAKDIDDENNIHLLKSKNGESVYNDLAITRNYFGQITDFRFYKEYFNHFDEFISLYESKSKKTRGEYPYKLIELYCGVLIHEPYLFDKIKMIVPDIVEKIQEFVSKIFWDTPKIRKDDLYYDWDNKNLFHLIFIVYKDANLFRILNSSNLSLLINSHVESQSDLDYILFKMSYYLDINTEERIKDSSINQSEIKSILNILLENNDIKDWRFTKLKRFRAFVSSLVDDNETFKSKLAKVKHNYDKIIDDKYHSESISTQFEILIMQLESLIVSYNDESVNGIMDAWEKVNVFITEILSFTITFPTFLSSFGQTIFDSIEGNENSLRIIHGRLADKIYRLNRLSNFGEISIEVKYLLKHFIKSNSEIFKIFKNISTYNILDEYEVFKNNIIKEYSIIVKDEISCSSDTVLAVPLSLIRNIVFEQLKNNLRHANFLFPVNIDIKLEGDNFHFSISNNTKNDSLQEIGGGLGINLLKNLNVYPDDLIKYIQPTEKDIFTQHIIIKII